MSDHGEDGGSNRIDPKKWAWVKIAYVVKRWSAQQCADEFGIDVTTIKKRASKEGWTKERHRNTTAGAEAVAEEMRGAAQDGIRIYADRDARVFRAFDKLMDRVEADLEPAETEEIGEGNKEAKRPSTRSAAETFVRVAEAYAKLTSTNRLVRAVPDNAPSDHTPEEEDEKRIDHAALVVRRPEAAAS